MASSQSSASHRREQTQAHRLGINPTRRPRTHGQARVGRKTREYAVWAAARTRCGNPKDRSYRPGIKFCERWSGRQGFQNFLADMGPRPAGFRFNRKNPDDDYCPENCFWGTRGDQMNNRRGCCKVTYNGETLTVMQWANRYDIRHNTLYDRLRRGWPLEQAIGIKAHQSPRASAIHRKARVAVGNAVARGILPRVKTLRCTSCPQPAAVYHHHKGYSKENWLNVVPLCNPCHHLTHRLVG